MSKLTILILTLVSLLVAAPASACNGLVTSTATSITVCRDGFTCREVLYSQLRNGSDNLRAEQVRAVLQSFVDLRLRIDTLPLDDPDRGTDPGMRSLFWGDADGNPANGVDATHLIGRGCLIEDVHWVDGQIVLTIRQIPGGT